MKRSSRSLLLLVLFSALVSCQTANPVPPTPAETTSPPKATSTPAPTATELPDQSFNLVSQEFETTILDAVVAPDNNRYVVLLADNDQMKLALYAISDPDTPLATTTNTLNPAHYGNLPKTHILHFAPDGKTLFALLDDGQTVQIWDAETLAPITSWGLPEYAEVLEINHAGDQIVSAGLEIEPIYILSYPDGNLIQTLDLPPAQHDDKISMMINLFRAAFFSTDDSKLWAYTPYVLYQWDLTNQAGTVLLEDNDEKFSNVIYPSQNGIYLFQSSAGKLSLLDATNGTVQSIALSASAPLGSTITISPYAQLASTSESTPGVFVTNLVNNETEFLTYLLSREEKNPLSISLFFSDDGTMLIGIFQKYDLRIWSLKSALRPVQ
ncbi:MAG: hypothetical protein GXP40_03025 [Chloroflexi bacterium]|nr:hypothetical protein [Chloroflexota bacterium]